MSSRNILKNRLMIVSNRLLVSLSKGEDGKWQFVPGSGGLVTALAPVLRNRGGIWIGWTGHVQEDGIDLQDLLAQKTSDFGYTSGKSP